MKEKILEELFTHINDMRYTINTINIANLNLDNPPKASIDKSSREWLFFYDECQDFMIQFSQEFDMEKLRQELDVRENYIYEERLTTIERELKKIERQTKLKHVKKAEIMSVSKPKKIFISHSTKDKAYAKALVELFEDIGIQENQMFCSSLREYGVKIGEDIYGRLKSEFNIYDLWVFFILSHNYYNSPASLNEMGAAWVLQKDYLSVLLPGFSFKDIKGAINPNKIGIQLKSPEIDAMLNDLKDQICNTFDCKISQNRWERIRKEFINKVNQIR